MTAAPGPPTLRVVIDGNGSITGPRRFEIVEALLRGGHCVACGPREAPAPADEEFLVLSSNGAGGAPDAIGHGRVHVRDIGELDVEAIVALADEIREQKGAYASGAWKPWFPVIDYDRCTNCMQCLSFCLFDVYGVDGAQQIEVRNNEKCKTNCPACSRVCPEVAILFPKYGSGPINGDVVNAGDVEREKMKTDISALLGGDIYSMLRERHKRAESRFAKERDESRALKERIKCLKKLGEQLDVPEEVLMALPSLDEIREKASRAYDESSGETATRDGSPEEGRV